MKTLLKYIPIIANIFGFLIIIIALLNSKKKKENNKKIGNDDFVSERDKVVQSKNTIILIIGVSLILIALLIKL